MPLKHQAYLATRPDQPCPCPRQFAPGKRKAFRFMHNLATEDDFDPPAIIDLKKCPTKDMRKQRCGRFALSFFVSVDAAQRRFASLAEREDAASRYGDHIGEIDLTQSDGLMGQPSSTGHFDLHQEANVLFAKRVINYSPAEAPDAP